MSDNNERKEKTLEERYKEWLEERERRQSSPIIKAGTFKVITGQKSPVKLTLIKGGKEK